MEHRLSKRIPSKLKLLIYRRGIPIATGQICDVSKRGLFIATDYLDIQLNQTLEIEFQVPEKSEKRYVRLKAYVVRKIDKGLGLDFGEANGDSFAISSLMHYLDKHQMPGPHFSALKQG
ncbi:PilZ domain-containing protein [Marinobacter antarcticus]|uniref:PilZ domain-containing protein n=1 Tax=Marinobacter antarcticus TaxID=564117 RepID=A0A1M6UF51_9GAMM|nr:PilZ domain-containing protein [Marinobacter antarcticus]SHK67834.1 PilZ domain-containing protein [Marinobacter antarcticus]